jgi:hypothetical protein
LRFASGTSVPLIGIGTLNPQLIVQRPALNAAEPVGPNTPIVLLQLKSRLTSKTSVLIHVLLPLPATPDTVSLIVVFSLLSFGLQAKEILTHSDLMNDNDAETNTAKVPLTGKKKIGGSKEKFAKSPNFTDRSDA